MIEIELAKDNKRFKKNILISCTIKREGNKSVFSIDGKPAGKRQVVELARSLAIQIDNLCQFLPQDKVVEFAAMTPIELLRSTQRAVASQEMIDMQESLKEFRRKQKEVQARVDADQDTLNNLEGRQRLQEADVERMREREQIEIHVNRLEIARPFARYRDERSKHRDMKTKKKEAQHELKALQDEVEPSLRAVNQKQRYKTQIGAAVGERARAVGKAEKTADKIDKDFNALHDRSRDCEKELQAEKDFGKKQKSEALRYEGAMTRLRKQMEEQPPELDVAAYNEKIVSQEGSFAWHDLC